MLASARALTPARVIGLDGIRGLAALFVVMHHIFLRAWPGYPVDHAPLWAAGFVYGRFAVIVFIALSGFSLALAPARSGWRFDSLVGFARRRAWRILPPYWAALGFSLLMTWFVLAQPGWTVPDRKSVLVYGLLLQDAIPAAIPNRAFWSIAIEAQLYILLPALLLIVRRASMIAMVAGVTGAVVMIGLLEPQIAVTDHALINLTPDLAVVFAIGVLAAGVVTAGDDIRSRPWGIRAARVGPRCRADPDEGADVDEHPPVLGRSGVGPCAWMSASRDRHVTWPADRAPSGRAPIARSRLVLLQPVPHARTDRDRCVLRTCARASLSRHTDVPRAVRGPVATDGVLCAGVCGRIRAAVPTAPGVGTPAGRHQQPGSALRRPDPVCRLNASPRCVG